jgi:hypothetical protein
VPRLVNEPFAVADVVDLHVGEHFRMDSWRDVDGTSGVLNLRYVAK